MVKPNKTVCFVISVILQGPVGSSKAFLSEIDSEIKETSIW